MWFDKDIFLQNKKKKYLETEIKKKQYCVLELLL